MLPGRIRSSLRVYTWAWRERGALNGVRKRQQPEEATKDGSAEDAPCRAARPSQEEEVSWPHRHCLTLTKAAELNSKSRRDVRAVLRTFTSLSGRVQSRPRPAGGQRAGHPGTPTEVRDCRRASVCPRDDEGGITLRTWLESRRRAPACDEDVPKCQRHSGRFRSLS